MSVSDHPLGREVACAVTAWASENVSAVVELVEQSGLSLLVDLQAAWERVQVEHCVSAKAGAGRVLPDTEDNPEPVPVVIQGKVDCPPTRTPWNDSSVMAILLPTRAAPVVPRGGIPVSSVQVVPTAEKETLSSYKFNFFSAWATMALLTCEAIFLVW